MGGESVTVRLQRATKPTLGLHLFTSKATHTSRYSAQQSLSDISFEIEQLPHAPSDDSFYFLIEAYAVGEESAVEPNLSFGRMAK